MGETRIALAGLSAQGRHGADPGEQLEWQEFVVDLEVVVDVSGDDIESTVDYRVIADAVQQAVAGGPYSLLETLAEAVAQEVFQYEGVTEVTAVVHKPRAAERLGLEDISAEVTIA